MCFAAAQCQNDILGKHTAYAIGGKRNPPATDCASAVKNFDWVSGTGQHTPFGSYTRWGKDEPTNCFQQKPENCVQLYTDDNTWNDYACDIKSCSICWIP